MGTRLWSSKVRAGEDENLLEPSKTASDTILETIRVAREINLQNNSLNNKINNDQEAQASENKKSDEPSSSIDELTLDSLEDDENRGKRFVFMEAANPSVTNYLIIKTDFWISALLRRVITRAEQEDQETFYSTLFVWVRLLWIL